MSAVRGLLATGAAALLLVLAGCGSVTSGHGSGGGVAAPTRADFPTQPPATAASTAAGSTTPPSATSTGGSGLSLSQRALQLEAQTNGEAHEIVQVPGGYEAATFDQGGDIQFWRNATAATSWTQVGQSSYPADPALGPPHATVVGALLRGMSDATFIVHGTFTTDGGGNAVAFTNGAGGWGAIKAESNGNIGPSGKPVGEDRIGLSFDFAFHDGALETLDCPTDRPLADCAAHPVVKLWAWTGHDFAQA